MAAQEQNRYDAAPLDGGGSIFDPDASVRRHRRCNSCHRNRRRVRGGAGGAARTRPRRSAIGSCCGHGGDRAFASGRRFSCGVRIKSRAGAAEVWVGGGGGAVGREIEEMAATELVHVETPPVLKSAPDLSILIVTWNSERWIERCLSSISAACEGLLYEVVLYDNSSADRTLRFVSDDIRSIASQSNDGFAGAINRAIASVRGPYVFLLNPDCELAPRCLALLVDFLRTHPNVAAAAPLLEDERGNSQREF